MVNWDDKAVYTFLEEFGLNLNTKHELRCEAAAKRVKFLYCNVDQLVQGYSIKKGLKKNYNIYQSRVKMFQQIHARGGEIGTLFCRKMKDGRFFIKDGNHRFVALKDKESTFRIAIDPEGKI